MEKKLFSAMFFMLFSIILLIASVNAVMINPSLCSGSWKNCTSAFSNDNKNSYITVADSNKSSTWEGYNFDIQNSSKIDTLKIRADFTTAQDGSIKIKVSRDGGETYGKVHDIKMSPSKKAYWINIINDFPWLTSDLTGGKLKIAVTCYTTSSPKTTCNLDWLPINVSYTKFDFSVKLNDSQLKIMQEKSAKILVNVSLLSGLPVPIKLSKTCPEEMSCSLSPNSGTPPFSSTLTITAKNSTPPEDYLIKVKAVGDGITKIEKAFVNVIPKPPEPSELCKPLKYEGSSLDNKINLVFVPSNFNGDMDLFKQKAEEAWDVMKTYEPFDSSIEPLNAFYVEKDEGSYCELECGGIPRLLCCDGDPARSISSECNAQKKQIIVIHNDSRYGGAAGGFDIVAITTHESAPKIAVHELGHSLFNLGDEYPAFSNPSTAPNCDFSECSKWNSMLGYKGVDCSPNSCANGDYYASETTIMRFLAYDFEEVNLRATCCAYYEETGLFPDYCSQFNQFSPNNDLTQYCTSQDLFSAFKLKPTTIRLENPYEYYFTKDKNGEWNLKEITKLKPGSYPISQVKGESKGEIEIETNSILSKDKLYFDDEIEIEYMKDIDTPGGYIKVPRKTLPIIIDHSNQPQEIKVNGNIAFFNENNLNENNP